MSENTAIEWCDATWNPLRVQVRKDAAEIAKTKGYTSLIQIAEKMAGRIGQHCEHVSDGCKECYAECNNLRCLPANGTGLPYDRRSRDLIQPFVDEKTLLKPLRWSKSKKVFPCNQTDLFGDWYTDEMIDRVFAVMALTPRHTYQVLTKRVARMLAYQNRVHEALRRVQDVLNRRRDVANLFERWPLPNVWMGVSVEDQKTADERIPLLLQTPAAVRFVSYEPALGPVDFGKAIPCGYYCDDKIGHVDHPFWTHGRKAPIDWIIIGGESGRKARPFDIEWARLPIEQCAAAGVACFMKQVGAFPVLLGDVGMNDGWATVEAHPCLDGWSIKLADRKGGDPSEWPQWMRVRQFPQRNGERPITTDIAKE